MKKINSAEKGCGGETIIINRKKMEAACSIVRENMLKSNAVISDSDYVFSDTFIKRMEDVFRKATVVFDYRYYSRLAASIVLVIAISIGSLFVVNAEAGNRFKNWLVTITDKSIVYSNDSKEIYNAGQYSIRLDDSENKYETSVLADLDFMKVISLDTDEQSILLSLHTDNTQTELVVSDYKYQQAVVNGMPADFYEVFGGDGTNELFWYDEEYGLFFNLSGQLKLNAMIELAQSIRVIQTE